ncbi:MAG: amidohydrolase family protein [Verrucomicrobiia bacterium]
MKFDANVFSGEYPFRRLRPTRGDGLLRLLDRFGVEKAVATAFPSIFYKDSLDGLRKTIAETEGCGTRIFHYAVLNPLLDGWQEDLRRALELPGVVGLRLFPRYHGYGLDDPRVSELVGAATANRLPIDLAARLVDDRLHPRFLASEPLAVETIAAFLERHPRATIIQSRLLVGEMEKLGPTLRSLPSAWLDVGGINATVTTLDRLAEIAPVERCVFGTGLPLFCAQGLWLALEQSGLSAADRAKVMGQNLQRLLKL